jgi:OOP family OmpA-OmpF porin
MMTRLQTVMATAMAATIAFSAPVMSEGDTGLSVEEMTAKFKKQKTRGLSIATPSIAPDATPEATSTATAATTEEVATIVPKEEQVNVNVSFDFDSAALREDEKPKLVQLCNALKAADVKKIRILGHTDASGSASYNQRLSKLRAEEVKRFLSSDCGYPADRMEALGVGEQFPFDPSDPRADVNRRVEFQALG